MIYYKMDQFQYEMSRTTQGLDDSPYVSKQWVYVNDTNNGSYGANQITFDASSLYNSQKFIGVNEMYIEVPLVVVMSQNAVNNMPANDWALGFKSGFFHCVDAMNVVYDGQTVQQSCKHSNFYTSFKINSTMSYNDLLTIGPTIGVYPDNATSWRYSSPGNAAAAGVSGVGITNNQNFPIAPNLQDVGNGETWNEGFRKRQLKTSVNASKNTSLLTEAEFRKTSRNSTKKVDGGTHDKDYQIYYVTATIRLGDISSFFSNCPLVKGFYARLTLDMNMGGFKLVKTALTGLSLIQNDVQFPNQTCPIMIAPLKGAGVAVSNALDLTTEQTEINVAIYIAKVTASPFGTVNHSSLGITQNHEMTACRLYAPMIELQPEKALSYINENRNKYVEFEDMSYVPLLNVTAGQNINFNVSNSVQNPVGLLVIPMIGAGSNSYAGASLYPHSSPFTCEPACTSPLGLSQFNVQLAGANVYPNSISYDYEMFIQEVLGCNAINGGKSMGLTSGLIDEIGFNNIYKYYYVNLERRSSDNVAPKSINITAVNNNVVPLDLHIFIVTRRSVTIDVETGKLVTSSQ